MSATLGGYVALFPHEHARGGATIVADIGAPVNAQATFYVRDEVGIGFGCYEFLTGGPSIRIVDGVPQTSSLADADVAVTGPGSKDGPGPSYGCWGENYDVSATSYRLMFHSGGRVLGTSFPNTYVKELPYDAVDAAHPLDILTRDGRAYRLHVTPAAGTYFTGWLEAIDDQGRPVEVDDLGCTRRQLRLLAYGSPSRA